MVLVAPSERGSANETHELGAEVKRLKMQFPTLNGS